MTSVGCIEFEFSNKVGLISIFFSTTTHRRKQQPYAADVSENMKPLLEFNDKKEAVGFDAKMNCKNQQSMPAIGHNNFFH